MGRSRQSIESVMQTVRNMRDLQATRLNREYAPSQRRLNEAYTEATKQINNAIGDYSQAGKVEPLQRAIETNLNAMQPQIIQESVILQSSGVKAGVDLGVAMLNKGGVNIRSTTATESTIQNAVDYVNSDAFQNAVNGLGLYHADKVGEIILAQMALGKNPATIAQIILAYFNTTPKLPLSDIENLTRTLLNYAARRATGEIYARNGVKQWVWVANLGNPRTCLSCVLLHGTIHDLAEEPFLNDHHRGRCAMAPITPSWSDLGLNGKDINYPTGQSYFDGLSDTQKRLLLGAELFEAYQRGQAVITPATVTGTYTNPIFGTMRRRNTNAEIIRLSP